MIYVRGTIPCFSLGRRPADDFISDAEDPTKPGQRAYVKIAGILVNSTYHEKEYLLVVGACVCAFELAFRVS